MPKQVKARSLLSTAAKLDSVTTDLTWQDGKAVQVENAWQMAGTDPKQVNTWEAPNQLTAKSIPVPTIDAGLATITLPPLSFTVFITRTA